MQVEIQGSGSQVRLRHCVRWTIDLEVPGCQGVRLFRKGWLRVRDRGYHGRVHKSSKRDFYLRSCLREKREMKKAKKGLNL